MLMKVHRITLMNYIYLSFVSMILLQTEQNLWNLAKAISKNELHVCINYRSSY